jgi:hypothetical protein
VLVDCAKQVLPLAADRHIALIHAS